MATSDRWAALYEQRSYRDFWRGVAKQADLYVSAAPAQVSVEGSKKPNDYRLLLDGSRVVPYAVRAGTGDPREDPRWPELIEKYRAPALEMLVERGYATANPGSEPTEKPMTGTVRSALNVGEYFRGSGDNSYWTNEEVTEERLRATQYLNIYKDAVSWWILLHGLNPDAITPYPDEVTRTIQQINMVEAGDPTMALILATTEPAAPNPEPVTASRYSSARPAATQAGLMNLDTIKKYWPYLAAGSLVLYMMQRKKKAT